MPSPSFEDVLSGFVRKQNQRNMMYLSPFVVLLEVFCFILMVIVVVGNTFVIEVVRRNYRLRTIPNICITSLAVADLFVGLINIPMYMYALYDQTILIVRTAQHSVDIYFGMTSILHLTFISMERCYAITFPMKRRFLQKATIGKILLVLWLISTIPVCLYHTIHSYVQMTLTMLFFFIPLVVVILSYTILAISARISRKKMEEHRVGQRKKDMKLAKTLCIVIIFFIVAWLPFFVVQLIAANHPKYLPMTETSTIYLSYFVKCLQYSNSAVNPFIYAFRQQEFSKAFKKLFQISKCYKRHHNEDSHHLQLTSRPTKFSRFHSITSV